MRYIGKVCVKLITNLQCSCKILCPLGDETSDSGESIASSDWSNVSEGQISELGIIQFKH